MNEEKLQALKERAEKAVRLAEEIAALKNANRFSGILRFEQDGKRFDSLMLAVIWDLGKAQLLDLKEAELNEILGEKAEPPAIVGVPWGGEAWEQPISGTIYTATGPRPDIQVTLTADPCGQSVLVSGASE